MEQVLDSLQNIAIHVSYRTGIEEEAFTISLARKAKLIERIYKRTPQIAPFAPLVSDAMKRVLDLADRRNDIVHGGIEGIRDGDPPTMVFSRTKVQRTGGFADPNWLQYSVQDINKLSEELTTEITPLLVTLVVFLTPFQKGDDKAGITQLLNLMATDPTIPSQELDRLRTAFGLQSSPREEPPPEKQPDPETPNGP
jgi:hypothetical protein